MLESLKLTSIKVVYHFDPTLYGMGVASELVLSFETTQDAELFCTRLSADQIKSAQDDAEKNSPEAKLSNPEQIVARKKKLNNQLEVLSKYNPPAIAANTIRLSLKVTALDNGERVNTLLEVMHSYYNETPELMTIHYPSTKEPKITNTLKLPVQSHQITALSLLNFEERELFNKMLPALNGILGVQCKPQLLKDSHSTVLSLHFEDAASLKTGKVNLYNWAIDNSVDGNYHTPQKTGIIGHYFILKMNPNFAISDLFETILNPTPAISATPIP